MNKFFVVSVVLFFSVSISFSQKQSSSYYYKAEELFNKFLYKEAIVYLDSSIILEKDNINVLYLRGECKEFISDLKSAEDDYKRVLKLDNESGLGYAGIGAVMFYSGKREESIEYLNKAIEKLPHAAKSYYDRGNARAFFGKFEDAFSDYDHAVKYSPENYKALNNAGACKFALREYEMAREYFEKAIKVNPGYINALLYKAKSNMMLEKYDEAIVDFFYVLSKDSMNYTALNDLGWCQSKLDNYNDAIKNYSKAISLNPSFGSAYWNRAAAYGEMKQYKLSIDDYIKAESFYTNDLESFARIREWRGMAYYYLKDYDQSIKDLDYFVNTLPDHREVYFALFNRAMSKMMLGDLEGALSDFERSVKLKPGDKCTNNEENLQDLRIRMHLDNLVNIYPNPFSFSAIVHIEDHVTLQGNVNNMDIYDISGKLIRSLPIESYYTKLMRDDLKNGVYLYRVISGESLIGEGKFTVIE